MAGNRLYEVFARRKREEPLSHIGTVTAADVDFARVYARTTYDEENWAEMTIVPRDAFVTVTELEPLVEGITEDAEGETPADGREDVDG